jgi:prepilin-type processing-associated H-X9-DG protein
MGTDWEDDWFEDYEEGDQLDEEMSRTASAGWSWPAQILPYIEQENLFTTEGANFAMGDGSVRFIAIAAQTWWAALSPAGGEVLGSDS